MLQSRVSAPEKCPAAERLMDAVFLCFTHDLYYWEVYGMDFRLTKEEALFQKMCRQFALNEVEPIAAEIHEQERYPEETVQKRASYSNKGGTDRRRDDSKPRGDQSGT